MNSPAQSPVAEPNRDAIIRFLRRYDLEGGYYTEMLWAALRTFKSVARPSPNIDHIIDAGKEIEFDEGAVILKYRELDERGLSTSEDAVDMARWVLETFKPLPPQVQVEATEQEIEIAARAIYDDFEPPERQAKPKWEIGGNSHKQTEARIYARSALKAARYIMDRGRV